jgi:hypothetical protein
MRNFFTTHPGVPLLLIMIFSPIKKALLFTQLARAEIGPQAGSFIPNHTT